MKNHPSFLIPHPCFSTFGNSTKKLMRNKVTAGLFALFFGTLGLHWFYLGQRTRGILYFIATLITFAFSVSNDAPFVLIMALVVLIDTLLLFSMPKEEFDEKYNAKFLNSKGQKSEQVFTGKKSQAARKPQVAGNPNKAAGIEKFKNYDYDEAIGDFKLALADKYDDPAVHFNLACCYSLLEKSAPGFFHLARAVQFGFVDFDKIEKHEALAFLRTQPEFQEFMKNGYQFRTALPLPENNGAKENSILKEAKEEENLLEQIKRLSELRNQGMLTREEFLTQTKQVLGR